VIVADEKVFFGGHCPAGKHLRPIVVKGDRICQILPISSRSVLWDRHQTSHLH
jgi:hypothetical protein